MRCKLKIEIKIWLPILLGLTLIISTFILSRLYLEIFSNEKISAFEKQNVITLANRDSMSLSYTLSHLEEEYNVNCIQASYNGNQFFKGNLPKEDCQPGFFKIKKSVTVGIDKKLTVDFLFQLPNQVIVVFIFFLILEVLILVAFYFSTLKFEQEKNSQTQLFNGVAKRAAHDLRSPLSALNSVAYTFSDKNDPRLDLIKETISRVNGIANDLLETNKLILNKNLVRKNTDIKTLLTIVINEKKLSLSTTNKKIQFNLNINSNPKLKNEHTLEVFRAVANIVENSIEAISETGEISVLSESDISGDTYLRIIDTGSGISEEAKDKIGKIEFTTKPSGNGLGLISSVERIHSLGGNLSIHPNQPNGTIVEIRLPKNI